MNPYKEFLDKQFAPLFFQASMERDLRAGQLAAAEQHYDNVTAQYKKLLKASEDLPQS